MGIECCRTDVLLAYPALSACGPSALRTRLIGTPNCPYEYFRGEQEWKFRVRGMVSRTLTANDPLNDQTEGEGDKRVKWLERFSIFCMFFLILIVISSDQFLTVTNLPF